MTVATDLVHPDLKKILLVEVTCGQHLTRWTVDTGTTYYATALYNIIDLEEGGASLTSRASIALVDANAGSYFYDKPNTRVYVHTTASADAHTVTLQAMLQFYYSDASIPINSQYYEPRLESVPNLSLRIEQTFGGISQISGGSLTLSNADGHFDDLADFQWDAGAVTQMLGTEVNGVVMAYGDYETMGTWLVNDWTLNDTKFTLSLSEYKVKIKKKIPFEFYDRATYPNIENEDIGRPIQIAYGVIKGAKPALINIATRTFKVAGHAIREYEQVRVLNEDTGAWEIKSFETTGLDNGTFTLSSSDWTYNQSVAVDFKGKYTSECLIMDNASDIVKDILETYLGESASTNDASFAEAFNRLDGGHFPLAADPGSGIVGCPVPALPARKTYRALGIYIWETQQVSEILEKINISVGSYLFANTAGEFIYRVFWPSRSEGLKVFDDNLIMNFSESTDNTNVFSKSRVTYDYRYTREWSEFKEFENTESQHIHDEQSLKLVEKESYLYDSDDAETLAERVINYEGKPLKKYMITVPARESLLMSPGDAVKLIYARHNLDGVYEILQISHNLKGGTSSLVLGDSHGLKDSSGFWVDASDTLPVRFANEAGYSAGSLVWNDSWSDVIATWAIQNVGYWTDSNGYASPTDSRSLRKSTWI